MLYKNPFVKPTIDSMVKNVRKIWDEVFFEKRSQFKKYSDIITYKDLFPVNVTLTSNSFPDIKDWLKDKVYQNIHKLIRAQIPINDKIVEVNFYYDAGFDMNNLNKNIKIIITRIYNLCLLFLDKKAPKLPWDDLTKPNKTILDYRFEIFLYSNPRRTALTNDTNQLDALHASRELCFNVSSGETDRMRFVIYNSKLEDILGLITHEVLHAAMLAGEIYSTVKQLTKVSFEYGGWGNINEYVQNTHASIIHSYLIHYELDKSINDSLKYEFIYQFIQTLRLGKIHGITLKQILQNNTNPPILFTQTTSLFEYIYARTLILFYYHKMNQPLKSCLTNMNQGINNIFDTYCHFDEFFMNTLTDNDNSKLINILDDIDRDLNEYNQNNQPEGQDVCGKFIMNYFCLDPIIIDEKYKLSGLYGGNKK